MRWPLNFALVAGLGLLTVIILFAIAARISDNDRGER